VNDYRGTQWLELGKTKIRVRYFSKVSLLECHREDVQEALYRHSKRERSHACLVTVDVEGMREDQLYVLYAFFKALLESFESKKHGYCIVSALLKEDEDPERNRVITAPLFNGVSTQPSLASARSTLRSQPSVYGDDNEVEEPSKEERGMGDPGIGLRGHVVNVTIGTVTASGYSRVVAGAVMGPATMPTENKL